MTVLLDIAALSALLLILSFVPVLGLRAEARITRQIRAADAAREAEATRRAHARRAARADREPDREPGREPALTAVAAPRI
ncbi:hypothetical protein [Streptomyces sp. NPDC008317]|uniref:hypothetical protein n=1 Tax=Streptomyces sp. NPDC008317 TaxID=3364827 RepID=UPI0036E44205